MDTRKINPSGTSSVDPSILAATDRPRQSANQTTATPICVLVAWRKSSALGVASPWPRVAPHICWLTPHVANPADLLPALRHQRPDVLLLAQDMFDGLGLDELAQLRAQFSTLRILLVAQEPTPELYDRVLRCRFHGILSANALRAICQGELWLSRGLLSQAVTRAMDARIFGELPSAGSVSRTTKAADILSRREQEVVEFVRQGLTNKEIACRLNIMEDTVKKHLQKVFGKLGVRRRTLVALQRA